MRTNRRDLMKLAAAGGAAVMVTSTARAVTLPDPLSRLACGYPARRAWRRARA